MSELLWTPGSSGRVRAEASDRLDRSRIRAAARTRSRGGDPCVETSRVESKSAVDGRSRRRSVVRDWTRRRRDVTRPRVTRTATREKVSHARRFERLRRARSVDTVCANDSIDSIDRSTRARRRLAPRRDAHDAPARTRVGAPRDGAGCPHAPRIHLFPGSASTDARRGWVRHSSARRDARA